MVLEFLNTVSFVLELYGAVLLFIRTQEKKDNWIVKYIASVFMTACVSFVPISRGDQIVTVILQYMIIILFVFCGVYLTCRISMKGAMYLTLCSYAVQHCASSFYIACQYVLGIPIEKTDWITWNLIPLFVFCYGLIYLLLYGFLIRKMSIDGYSHVDFKQSAEVMVLVIPLALLISLVEKMFGEGGLGFLLCQIYAMISSILILWIQYWEKSVIQMQLNLEIQEKIMNERRKQFHLSLANVDLINRKCHDLKYQIEALKRIESEKIRNDSIEELEQAVEIYDTSLQTGNEILDTVIMEKSLLCQKWKIQFTSMADGKRLEFMNPMDLYVLLGNGIDNAIEASRQITDQQRRVISLSVFAKGSLTIVQIENNYEGILQEPEHDPSLPGSSKKDTEYHGFGLKSIRTIAEKYDGAMSLHTDQGVFVLSVVFPSH